MAQPVPTPPSAHWELPDHPHPDDLDWDLMATLHSDRTLVDLADIAAMCGMANSHAAWLWFRAAKNYLLRGYREWPPSVDALKNEVHGTPDNTTLRPPPDGPVPYFTHPSVLPPPDFPGRARGQDRWYKGTIYRWGMQVRRISPTGEPLRRTSRGPAKGRGPVKGRKLVRHHDDS